MDNNTLPIDANRCKVDTLIARLSEEIIADAFEAGRIVDGRLAERLIRERGDAADLLRALRP